MEKNYSGQKYKEGKNICFQVVLQGWSLKRACEYSESHKYIVRV